MLAQKTDTTTTYLETRYSDRSIETVQTISFWLSYVRIMNEKGARIHKDKFLLYKLFL